MAYQCIHSSFFQKWFSNRRLRWRFHQPNEPVREQEYYMETEDPDHTTPRVSGPRSQGHGVATSTLRATPPPHSDPSPQGPITGGVLPQQDPGVSRCDSPNWSTPVTPHSPSYIQQLQQYWSQVGFWMWLWDSSPGYSSGQSGYTPAVSTSKAAPLSVSPVSALYGDRYHQHGNAGYHHGNSGPAAWSSVLTPVTSSVFYSSLPHPAPLDVQSQSSIPDSVTPSPWSSYMYTPSPQSGYGVSDPRLQSGCGVSIGAHSSSEDESSGLPSPWYPHNQQGQWRLLPRSMPAQATTTQYSTQAAPTQHSTQATPTQHSTQAAPTQHSTQATPTQYTSQATATQYSTQATPAQYTSQATATQYSTQATPAQYTSQATATQYSTVATTSMTSSISGSSPPVCVPSWLSYWSKSAVSTPPTHTVTASDSVQHQSAFSTWSRKGPVSTTGPHTAVTVNSSSLVTANASPVTTPDIGVTTGDNSSQMTTGKQTGQSQSDYSYTRNFS